MADLDADQIIARLGLVPLGFEGGFYAEHHRSPLALAQDALPERYRGPRRASTAIYYLLTPSSLSLMHRLKTAEVYHFYLGDPVEQLMLHPDGSSETVELGSDLLAGQRVQHVVPEGVWQGSRLKSGGRFALMGTTMAPGFELDDFELGDRAALVTAYPDRAELLDALTPVRLTEGGLELAAATLDLLHAHLRGPETLATGLRSARPDTWPAGWPSAPEVEAALAALEADPERRGWGLWYVLDRDTRAPIGAARFEGPPSADGVARLSIDAPAPHTEAALAALEAHARRDPRVRVVEVRPGR